MKIKNITLSFIFLIIIISTSFAKTDKSNFKYATTENGKLVKLFEDGTYEYTKIDEKEAKITGKFSRNPEITNFYKSNIGNFKLYYDNKVWNKMAKPINSQAELSLSHKAAGAYSILITERVNIPLSNFKNVILINARKASPDAQILKSGYRKVNGSKIMFIELLGTVQGMILKYYYYLYSKDNITVQLIVFSSMQNFRKYDNDFTTLLNGLTFMEEK